jgi:predicted dehydrogenase
MRDMISLALVGIGGYGNSYVSALLDAPPAELAQFRWTAAIDPAPQSCRRLGELESRGVRVFRSLDDFTSASAPTSSSSPRRCISTPRTRAAR